YQDISAKPVDEHTTWQAFIRDVLGENTDSVGSREIDPEPLPFVPFPVDALPAPVADLVRAGAASLGVDPSLIALPALGALSAAVGNSYRIELKRGWVEPGTGWFMPIAASGGSKSPAMDLALEP